MAAAAAYCLKNLEYLSLVSKVFSELETHLSLGDKVVASFDTKLLLMTHNIYVWLRLNFQPLNSFYC